MMNSNIPLDTKKTVNERLPSLSAPKIKKMKFKIYRQKTSKDTEDYIFKGKIPKINTHFRFKIERNIKMRLITKVQDNQNQKFEFKKIVDKHNVFQNENNKLYHNDYLNKVFKLLRKKDKNYYIKRKGLDIKNKNNINPNNIKDFYLTGEKLIQKTVNKIDNKALTTENYEESKKKIILLDSSDSDFSDDFNENRIIKKLKVNYNFYKDNATEKKKLILANKSNSHVKNNNIIKTILEGSVSSISNSGSPSTKWPNLPQKLPHKFFLSAFIKSKKAKIATNDLNKNNRNIKTKSAFGSTVKIDNKIIKNLSGNTTTISLRNTLSPTTTKSTLWENNVTSRIKKLTIEIENYGNDKKISAPIAKNNNFYKGRPPLPLNNNSLSQKVIRSSKYIANESN